MREKTRPFSSTELSKDLHNQVSKQVGEIIPPYEPEIPKIETLKKVLRGICLVVIPVVLLAFLGTVGFGIILNYFGGHNSENAWFWAFASTGIILLIGPLLNFYLRKH